GVDVALAPRDEGERRRSIDRAEDESRDCGSAELARRAARALTHDEKADQDGCREEQPQLDERDRVEVAHADLDEQIRRAPDRRQRQQENDVAATHALRLAADLRRLL